MQFSSLNRWLCFVVLMVVAPFAVSINGAHAQTQADAEEMARKFTETYVSARKSQEDGPKRIVLNEGATLDLPIGYSFISKDNSAELMKLMGNDTTEGYLGMVVATRDLEMAWLVAVSFTPTGWIDDSQSHLINPDALLATINSRFVKAAEQVPKGALNPPMPALSWLVPPAYDKAKRTLHWLLHIPAPGNLSPAEQGINDKFIVLGRKGFLVANLATSLDNLQPALANAEAVVKGLSFTEGHRYDDYRAGDPKAAFDITALIIGDPALPIVEQKREPTGQSSQSPGATITSANNAPTASSITPTWINAVLWGFALLVFLLVVADGFRSRKKN